MEKVCESLRIAVYLKVRLESIVLNQWYNIQMGIGDLFSLNKSDL